MTLCKDCQHWERTFYRDWPDGNLAPHHTGQCHSTYFIYNSDIPTNGLGYDSTNPPSLKTGEDFGCVHGVTWEER